MLKNKKILLIAFNKIINRSIFKYTGQLDLEALFKTLHPDLKNDRETILLFIETIAPFELSSPYSCTDIIKHVNIRFKQDKEFALTIVRLSPHSLKYFDESLKNDKDVVFTAVEKQGRTLKYASERLQSDEKIVLAAINNHPDAAKYANI